MKEKHFIQVYKLPINKLPAFFSKLFEEEFNLKHPNNEKIVEKHLIPYLDHLKEDLNTIIEFPYVDKMYRDAFYNYYASKLRLIERETIRISFFSKDFDLSEFRDTESYNDLSNYYKGFLVLRPTFPKIIGRSAIAPSALRKDNIRCCKAPIKATVNSLKFSVDAFPHASQDSQAITCAETTIWALMEYFGNKYPEYKPVLPSEILKILKKFSYKRQLPSDGLSLEQVAFTVRELGFGTMIYTSGNDFFKSIVSMFIGSGIPIIGVLKKEGLAHAVNIIGREQDNLETLVEELKIDDIGNEVKLLDYDKVDHNYVFIDDNHPPYQIATIENAVKYYSSDFWNGWSLRAIVVPLYHKIYLDPIRAKSNFVSVLRNRKIGVKDSTPRVIRTFLASSRSYKEYIALNKNLASEVKEFILTLQMPKFIWVAEISHKTSFVEGKVDGVLLQDATEPTEPSDETHLTDIPVFCSYIDDKVFGVLDNQTVQFTTFARAFQNYQGNLN